MKNPMGLAIKFIHLPLNDKYLYLEAVFWLAVSRIAILFFPFKRIAPFLGKHMAEDGKKEISHTLKIKMAISKAVESMGRHLPWECRCLVRAMAGKKMLDRRRIPATLYLGMGKAKTKGLSAHAWLSSGTFILTGKIDLERFAVVSTFS